MLTKTEINELTQLRPVLDFIRAVNLLPDQYAQTKADVVEGRLVNCAIVEWNVMVARARLDHGSWDMTPPVYESYWGDPGIDGWNIRQAFEYLEVSQDEIDTLLQNLPSET